MKAPVEQLAQQLLRAFMEHSDGQNGPLVFMALTQK